MLGVKKFIGYAAGYAGAAILQKGLGFVLFMWLANSLSTERYAEFGLLYALNTGVSAFVMAGIIEVVAGMVRKGLAPEEIKRIWLAANNIFLLLAAVVISGAALALDSIQRYTHAELVGVVAVVFSGIIASFFVVQSNLARLDEKFDSSIALAFFPPVVGLIAGGGFFFLKGTVTSFFVGLLGGFALFLIVFRVMGIGRYSFGGGWDVRSLLPRLLPYMLIALIGWVMGYGNTYLIKWRFSDLDVARFTFLYTVSSIMQLVATSLNQVWSPQFFKLVHDQPISVVESRNAKFFLFQGAMLGIVGMIVLVVLPYVLSFGGFDLGKYGGASIELFFLFAAYAVSIPWYHAQNYFYAHNEGRAMLHVTLVTSALGVLLLIGSMLSLGVLGVYVGFFFLMLSRSLGMLIWSRSKWGIKVLWQGPCTSMFLMALGAVVGLNVG